MIVHCWDEIDCEWSTKELPIPLTRDPQAINHAIGQLVAEDKDGDGFTVASHATTGPILTIEARDDHGHLAITVVNFEEQDD